jgi:hypothetical protein
VWKGDLSQYFQEGGGVLDIGTCGIEWKKELIYLLSKMKLYVYKIIIDLK